MNDLVPHEQTNSVVPAQTAALVAREQQEIQGAMILARKFPRDQGAALKRIEQSCADIRVAETAEYSYPRGGQEIIGPTIRLLEVIKQNWGNIRAGIKVTHQDATESHATAYAWDLETNDYHDVSFVVPHWRDTKKGGHAITDKREIYELVANYGSRRLRKCLETVIPRHIIAAARDAAVATMSQAGDIEKRRKDMVAEFGKIGITADQIEKRLGKKIIGVSNPEIMQMRRIFASLRDGMSKPEDWFEMLHDPKKIVAEQNEAANGETAKATFDAACKRVTEAGADWLEILRHQTKNAKLTIADMSKATPGILQAAADILKKWSDDNQS